MSNQRSAARLIHMLVCLSLLLIFAQVAFFFVHYKVSEIIDSLASSSIAQAFLHPVIWLPILIFVGIQLLAYGLIIAWAAFVSISLYELFKLSSIFIYWFGISIWLLNFSIIFALNAYYYPGSFFAEFLQDTFWVNFFLMIGLTLLLIVAALAYINCFGFKRHRLWGSLFIVVVALVNIRGVYPLHSVSSYSKPNIIFIGLDSLRPDYTGYFGNQEIHTPNIDNFLKSATVFNNAFAPLARTFPSWISILTAKYPLHHHARMNLENPQFIVTNDMLGKKLKLNGYFTIFGIDEVRFADITPAYGFDRVIRPSGGAVGFLIGGLSDFPLTNLLINLPIGQFLFPYNYGSRASDITYEPDKFLQLVKEELANRPNKPLFLAIHLCLPHWPFRWAHDGQPANLTLPQRYQRSVEAVDKQLGDLLTVLQQAGLLQHSIVVLLSDHGVALGGHGDRIITPDKYRGSPSRLKLVGRNKLFSAPDFTVNFKQDYGIDISYGQGTDLLSLTQHHVLMAFKGFGETLPVKQVSELSSLLDIAPTILDYLHFPPLAQADGVSVASYFSRDNKIKFPTRSLFFETGDRIAETENNKIFIDQVLKHAIGAYRIDMHSGALVLDSMAEKSLIRSKQRAIIWRGWLLVRYPADVGYKMVADSSGKNKKMIFKGTLLKPYYVLVNLKTGLWTVELNSPLANTSPLQELMRQFKLFYGEEV
jgi:arylsulfatase A-like enzyme